MAGAGQNASNYRNDSQQCLMAVVEALARTWPVPQSAQTLAQAVGCSRDQAYRACVNLFDGGWAEQADEGWLISPKLAEIANRMRITLANLHHRYLEITTNP